jgi:hypothetical protein
LFWNFQLGPSCGWEHKLAAGGFQDIREANSRSWNPWLRCTVTPLRISIRCVKLRL